MSSSISEGGIGTSYEFRVTTYLWGLLAAEDIFPPAGDKITVVACQRSHLGTGYDDFQVRTSSSGVNQEWFLQSKRTIKFTRSSPIFEDLVLRVQRDAAKPEFSNAKFVLVGDFISETHLQSAQALTQLARLSLTQEDFISKLPSENQHVRDVFETIQDIVVRNSPGSGLERVFQTVRAMYVWRLKLEESSSYAWMYWHQLLIAKTPSSSRAEASDLRRRFYDAAANHGRNRAEHDFNSLRKEFPYFNRERLADPSASPLAVETLIERRRQVASWNEERHLAAFETLGTVRSFLASARTWFLMHGSTGSAAQDYKTTVAEAIAVEGSILLTLDFQGEFSTWMKEAFEYAASSDALREIFARIALESGDRQTFEEWKDRVQDHEGKTLLAALGYGEQRQWDAAVSLARSVKGVRRPIALTAARVFLTEKAAEEVKPIESARLVNEALELAEEAAQLAPERPMIRLIAAEAAFLTVKPGVSRAYEGATNVTPSNIGSRLDQAGTLFRDVLEGAGLYGVHERTMAGMCVLELLEACGTSPSLPKSFFEVDESYISACKPERQFSFAVVCLRFGEIELAGNILERLQSEGFEEDIRANAKALIESAHLPPSAIEVTPQNEVAPSWVWGTFCFKSAVQLLKEGSSVTVEIVHQVKERAPGTCWVPAVELIQAVADQNEAAVWEGLDLLKKKFPEAVLVFGVVSIALSETYARVCLEPDGLDDNHRLSSRKMLSAPNELLRDWTLNVLKYCADAFGLSGAITAWLYTAANPLDRRELERIAEVCQVQGRDHERITALFLAEFSRRRARQAIDIFKTGLEIGWNPSASMRYAYDSLRCKLGLWDEVAKEARGWLEISHRHPTYVEPGVQSLLHLGRIHEAVAISRENADAFPGSADAAFVPLLVAQTIGTESWVSELIDFRQRFSEDPRGGALVSSDDADELLTMPHPSVALWEAQSKGHFPLHYLDDQCFVSFERAVLTNGLTVWGAGVPPPRSDHEVHAVLLDWTAVLTTDHLGLWEVLQSSRIGFLIHPSVVDYLRSEAAYLELSSKGDLVSVAERVDLFIRSKLAPTIGLTDEEEALRIGGVVCNSWDHGSRTLLSLIKSSTLVGRAELVALVADLSDQFERAPGEGLSVPENRIVLSAQDVIAICKSNCVDSVLACFEDVSISQTGVYWLGRFLSTHMVTARVVKRARRVVNSMDLALETGWLRMCESDEEPPPTSFRYIGELVSAAKRSDASIWVDDAWMRKAIAHSEHAPHTLCCWDLVTELETKEELQPGESKPIFREAVRSGFLPALRWDAIELLASGVAPSKDIPFYIRRICLAMDPHGDEPIESRHFELVIAADQFLHLVKMNHVEWRSVAALFRSHLTRRCQPYFWTCVFVRATGLEKSCWDEVKELATDAERIGQFNYADCLFFEFINPRWTYPESSIKNREFLASAKFEIRWKHTRYLLLKGKSAS